MSEFNAKWIGKLSQESRPSAIERLKGEMTRCITDTASAGGYWHQFEFRKWYWIHRAAGELQARFGKRIERRRSG